MEAPNECSGRTWPQKVDARLEKNTRVTFGLVWRAYLSLVPLLLCNLLHGEAAEAEGEREGGRGDITDAGAVDQPLRRHLASALTRQSSSSSVVVRPSVRPSVPYDFNPRKGEKGGGFFYPPHSSPTVGATPPPPPPLRRKKPPRGERPFWGNFDMHASSLKGRGPAAAPRRCLNETRGQWIHELAGKMSVQQLRSQI